MFNEIKILYVTLWKFLVK